MVLVFGASLMLKSFARMNRIPLGFDERNTLVVGLSLPERAYPEGPRRVAFTDQVAERAEALPGVLAAGWTTTLPVRNQGIFGRFNIKGRAPASDSELLYARYALVRPGTLKMLGIPLIRGRYLEAADGERARGAVVISQSMAELYWGDGDPLGQEIQRQRRPEPDKPWLTVVGVVGDVVYGEITEGAEPAYYLPYAQHAPTRRALSLNLLVRTDSDPEAQAASVREAVRSVDPALPIPSVSTLRETVSGAYADHRSSTLLTGILAGIALLLGMVGIYGVMSYFVDQGAREIGIRMSVGATSADVLWQVLRRGMTLALAGLFLGALGAVFLTRFLEAQLYQVEALDPFSFAAASLGLAAVALTANYFPARRAARTDPVVTLRYE